MPHLPYRTTLPWSLCFCLPPCNSHFPCSVSDSSQMWINIIFVPVSVQPKNKLLWKADVIAYWNLITQVMKEPRSKKKDGKATHRLVSTEERLITTQGGCRDKGKCGSYWSPESKVTQHRWDWHPACVETRPQGRYICSWQCCLRWKELRRNTVMSAFPPPSKFPNSTSLWPNPASSQQMLEPGKCSLQGSDGAVQRKGYERIWEPSDSTLDDLPSRKVSVPHLKPSVKIATSC